VDAIFDGREVYVGGVMEHVEEAGVHSGDSACALPPVSATKKEIQEMVDATTALARALDVRGLINVQFARSGNYLFVLEANPRASRTVPFVSKATGVALARVAARVMAGASINELRSEGLLPKQGDGSQLPDTMPISVKEAVLPFNRFAGVDTTLGPEMKSTGEVMGLARDFASAFAKAQAGVSGEGLPNKGAVLVSLADKDKPAGALEVKKLMNLGFEVYCTAGTADFMAKNDLKVRKVFKVRENQPGELSSVDVIDQGLVDLVINTPMGQRARGDGYEIRSAASSRGVAYVTTLRGFQAAVAGIAAQSQGPLPVRSIQAHIAEVGLLGAGSR
jgi:carbamoyl-phosphate synthase large subunit